MVNGNLDEKGGLNSGGEPWWKPGVALFSEVTTWIAWPIIVALIAGKWLDGHFDTKPKIFLALALLAFIISAWNIYKIVKKYTDKINKVK